jgi:mRNA-degrading endonuclease RelE of RelBE toxin-antitoxin system
MRIVKFTNRAVASLEKIGDKDSKRILGKIEWLADHPHPQSLVTAIKNPPPGLEGICRLRVGDYRIIIAFENEVVVVYDVGHRSKIY